MAGESCPVRQHGNQRERNLLRPCSCPTCTICGGKLFLRKAFTISGADRFSRRGGTCRLHAIFMNQSAMIWGYQDELSSMGACRVPKAYIQLTIEAGCVAPLFCHVCNPPTADNIVGVKQKNDFSLLTRKLSRFGRVFIFSGESRFGIEARACTRGACCFARTRFAANDPVAPRDGSVLGHQPR